MFPVDNPDKEISLVKDYDIGGEGEMIYLAQLQPIESTQGVREPEEE